MSKQRPDTDKLSNELAGASAFFRPAAPAVTPSQASPAAPPTPLTTTSRDVVTSRRQDVTMSAAAAASREKAGFDINRPTASRDSLRLAIDETRALDELRSALKWDHDLTVSKNDICRAALHYLLEDYRAKGEKSAAIARLKRKQTSR